MEKETNTSAANTRRRTLYRNRQFRRGYNSRKGWTGHSTLSLLQPARDYLIDLGLSEYAAGIILSAINARETDMLSALLPCYDTAGIALVRLENSPITGSPILPRGGEIIFSRGSTLRQPISYKEGEAEKAGQRSRDQ